MCCNNDSLNFAHLVKVLNSKERLSICFDSMGELCCSALLKVHMSSQGHWITEDSFSNFFIEISTHQSDIHVTISL